MIVDPIDLSMLNPQIEKIDFTPADLKKQKYDQEVVDELLDNLRPVKPQKEKKRSLNAKLHILVTKYTGSFQKQNTKEAKGLEVIRRR